MKIAGGGSMISGKGCICIKVCVCGGVALLIFSFFLISHGNEIIWSH